MTLFKWFLEDSSKTSEKELEHSLDLYNLKQITTKINSCLIWDKWYWFKLFKMVLFCTAAPFIDLVLFRFSLWKKLHWKILLTCVSMTVETWTVSTIFRLRLRLGFVHPLQDVALHQCPPSMSSILPGFLVFCLFFVLILFFSCVGFQFLYLQYSSWLWTFVFCLVWCP